MILPTVMLEAMRNSAERMSPGLKNTWKQGAKTFFKGTHGRWQDMLSTEELALYEEKAAQVFTPGCQAWLEQGRKAF